MMSLGEYKDITYMLFFLFFIVAAIYSIMGEFVMRIKNKKKISKKNKVTHIKMKMPKIDYNELIISNFGNSTYLYENKNRMIELFRLLNL